MAKDDKKPDVVLDEDKPDGIDGAIDVALEADSFDAAVQDPPIEAKPEEDEPAIIPAEAGIEDFKQQLSAAQQTAEAERRLRLEAQRLADERAQEANRLRVDVEGHRLANVSSALDAVIGAQDAAENRLHQAYEAGDFKAVASTQRELSEISARRVQIEAIKSSLSQPPQPTTEGRVQPPQREAAPQPNAFDQYVSQFSPTSQAWLRQHPDYVTDEKLNRKLIAAHHAAVADDLKPDTPDYFAFVETNLGVGKASQAVPQAAPKAAEQRRAPVAAPVARDSASNGGRQTTIRLTPAQREAARISGISETEYARQLLAIKADQAANQTTH